MTATKSVCIMYLKVKVLVPAILLMIDVLFRKATAQIYDEVDGCIGNICFQDPTYPYQEIQGAWKNKSQDIFNTLGAPSLSNNISKHEMKSRGLCKLCETKISKKLQLMSILDDANLKLYVMSTTKYPRPSIYLETCRYNESPCSLDNLPNDMMTRCVQKRTTINLLTFNATSNEFVAHALHYPSACECVLIEIDPDD